MKALFWQEENTLKKAQNQEEETWKEVEEELAWDKEIEICRTTFLSIHEESELAKIERLVIWSFVIAICSFLAAVWYLLRITGTETRRFYLNIQSSQDIEIEGVDFSIQKKGSYAITQEEYFLYHGGQSYPGETNQKKRILSDFISLEIKYKTISNKEEEDFFDIYISDSLKLYYSELEYERNPSHWNVYDHVVQYQVPVDSKVSDGSQITPGISFKGDLISTLAREVDLEFEFGRYSQKIPIQLEIKNLSPNDVYNNSQSPSEVGYDYLQYEHTLSRYTDKNVGSTFWYGEEKLNMSVRDHERGRDIDNQIFLLGSFLGVLASFIASILWDIMKSIDHEKSRKIPGNIKNGLTLAITIISAQIKWKAITLEKLRKFPDNIKNGLILKISKISNKIKRNRPEE